jgi:basic membrane protein A
MFAATVQAVQSGSWSSGQFWGTMSDHTVGLAPLNPIVPDDVRALVEYQKQQMLQGLNDVFVGPLRDQRGQVRLKAGQRMTDSQLLNLGWFVAGVKTPPATDKSKPAS